MKLFLKHNTTDATQLAEPLLAADLPYVEQTFDSVIEITVAHPYPRIVRVDLANPTYKKIPETRIVSIQYLEHEVHVVFLELESGHVVVRP